MEPPRLAVTAQRLLAAAVLAAALAAAWAQRGSELDRARRESRPWVGRVAAREPGGREHALLAVYRHDARRLVLLHAPTPKAAARLAALVPPAAPSPAIVLELPELAAEDEPAAEAARALKAAPRRPSSWAGLRAAGVDGLLLALELRRLPLERLEPARFEDDSHAPKLAETALSAPEAEGRATTAEVLNAAGEPGLASRAAKMLRLRGVDVVSMGAAAPRARTMVYDRTGDFARAHRILRELGCPTGRAATRPDASRVVDVSVELGADCAGRF